MGQISQTHCATGAVDVMTESLLKEPISVPAAWRGDDMLMRSDWRIALDADDVAEIESAMRHLGNGDNERPLTQLRRDDFELPTLAPRLLSVLDDIEHGRGFVLLQGLPVTRWGEQYTRNVLWGLGCHLGWAEGQDREGKLIHDVRDIGQKFGANDTIRYFQTNQAIDFHNDGADIFALLCLRTGRSGGHSRLVSAVEVFNTIAKRRPDLALVLQQEFHVDARGQRQDGSPCQVIPVFSYVDGHLNVLLKHAYILSAQRFDDVPRLTAAQTEALELLNSVMEDDGMAMEFDLAAGDVLIASNHTLLHGRTAFSDDSEQTNSVNGESSGGGRHMLRLWLTVPNGHALPPHYADTREFAATYQRRIANTPTWPG